MMKYSKGDKLWIEVEVTNPNWQNESKLEVKFPSGAYNNIHLFVDEKFVRNHIPAAKPIEIGCKVIEKSWTFPDDRYLIVRGIYKDVVFYESSNDYNLFGSMKMENLVRID